MLGNPLILFKPRYKISHGLVAALLKLEGIKERVNHLPLTPSALASLRARARLFSTHYSTQIEGNRLSEKEVEKVIISNQRFPGRARDEKEVKGYYRALAAVEEIARQNLPLTERQIQIIHGHVMGAGKKMARPTPYREGQNVIKDSLTRRIVYMPPEAKDVPPLMAAAIDWLNSSRNQIPCPIRAAIAHYQFATIHPYYDGNGRTGRLLTNLILYLEGYGLKGIYSLEEYYARDLQRYYDAIAVGPSHNYYEGRAGSDITDWLQYFINGMTEAFAQIEEKIREAKPRWETDKSPLLRKLDPRQRTALTLFVRQQTISSLELAALFSMAPRTARVILKRWVDNGFLAATDPSKKARRYKLVAEFEKLITAE